MGPTQRIAISQCIGCGAMHEDFTCDGPCSEQRLELVTEGSFDAAGTALEAADARLQLLRAAASECASMEAKPGDERPALERAAGLARAALQQVHGVDSPAPSPAEDLAPEEIVIWRCTECGGLDEPQECIDVCIRRKVLWVDAGAYRELTGALQATLAAERRLVAVLDRIAYVRPRAGEWERNWRALQSQARAALTEARVAGPLSVAVP